MSTWTDKMHARAREATEIYYPDSLHKAFLFHALDEIERLRAECQRLANETKHPVWANITEDMVERAAEEFWDRPTETAPTATRMRLITRAALEAALGKANK